MKMVNKKYISLNIIEEITRNDNTKYYELANVELNGRAELAVNRGFIKNVRIVSLNIPSSNSVKIYENYINKNYSIPDWNFDKWIEWDKSNSKISNVFNKILHENHII